MTDEGFYDWGMSINFGTYLLDASGVGSYHGECFGQTDGARQAANLGDGNGMRASRLDVLSGFDLLPLLRS